MLKQPYQPFEWIEMDKNGQVVKIQNLFSLEGVKFKNKPPEPPRRTPEQVAQDIEIINQPRKSLEEEYKEIQQKKWRNQPYYENKNKGRNQPYYENKNKGRNQPYYENKNKGRNQPYYENKNKGRNQPYYENKNWRRNNYKGNIRYPFFSRWKRPFYSAKPQVKIHPKAWKKLNHFKYFDANALATTMFYSEVRRRVKVSSPYKRFYLKKNGLTLLSSKLVFSWSRSVFQKLIFIFLLELLNIGQKTYTRKFLFLQIIKAETLLGYYNRIQFHSLNIGGICTDSVKKYSGYRVKTRLKKMTKKRFLKRKLKRKNSIDKKKKLFRLKLIPHMNRRFRTKRKRYWWGNPGSKRVWVKGQSLKRMILVNPKLGMVSKLIKFFKGNQQVFLPEVAVGAFVYSCNKRHWKWKTTPAFLAQRDWLKVTRYDLWAKKVAMQTISSFLKSRNLVLKIKRRRLVKKNSWFKNKKTTALVVATGLKQGKRVVRKLKTKGKKNQGSKKIQTKLKKWIKKRIKKVVQKKRKTKVRKIRSILWDKRRGLKDILYFQDIRYAFQKNAFKVRDRLVELRTLREEAVVQREKRKAYIKRIFLRGMPLKINVVRKKFRSARKEVFLFQSQQGKFKSLYKTSRLVKPKKLNVWWMEGFVQDETPYISHERKLRKFFFRRYSGRKMWLRQKRWVLTRMARLRPKLVSVLSGESRLKTSNFSLPVIKKIAVLIKTSLFRYVFLFWLTFLTLREFRGAAYFYKPFVSEQVGDSITHPVQRILNNFSDIVHEDNVFLIPSLSRIGEIYKNNFLEREELGVKSRRLKYIEAHGVQKKRQSKSAGFGKIGGLQNTTESILKYFWFIAFKYRKKQKTPGVPQQVWFFNAVGRQLKKNTQRKLQLFFPKSESKRKLVEKISMLQYQQYADNFLVTRGQFAERLYFYQTILSRRSRVYWRRRALAKLLPYVKLSSEIKPGKKKTLNAVLLGREKGGLSFQKVEPRFNRKTSAFCNRVNVKFKAVTTYLASNLVGQNETSLPPVLVGVKKFKTWASVPIIKIFWMLLLSHYLFKNWQKIFIKYFSLKQKKTTQIPVPGRIILNGFRGKGWRKNRLLYRQARPFWFYTGFQNFNSEAQKKRNLRNRNYNKKERAHDLYIKQVTKEQYFTKIFQPWALDTRFFINTRQLKTNFFLSLFNNLKRKKIFDVTVSSNIKSTVQFKRKGWKKNKIDRTYLKPVIREKGVADPLFYVRKYIKVLKQLSGVSYNIRKRPILFQTLVLSVLCKCIVSRQLLKNMSKIQKGKVSKKNVKKKKAVGLLLKIVRGWRKKKKKTPYLLYIKWERRGHKFKNADAAKNNRNIRHWWYICRYIYTQYAYWYLSQEKPLDKVAWTVSKFRRNVSGLFRNYPTRIRAILPPLGLMRNKYAGEEEGYMADITLADEVGSEKVQRYLIKRARTYLRYSAVPFDNLFIFRRKRRSLIKIRYLFKQLFLWIYQQKSTKFKLGAEIRRSLFKNFFFKNIFIFRKNVRRY